DSNATRRAAWERSGHDLSDIGAATIGPDLEALWLADQRSVHGDASHPAGELATQRGHRAAGGKPERGEGAARAAGARRAAARSGEHSALAHLDTQDQRAGWILGATALGPGARRGRRPRHPLSLRAAGQRPGCRRVAELD